MKKIDQKEAISDWIALILTTIDFINDYEELNPQTRQELGLVAKWQGPRHGLHEYLGTLQDDLERLNGIVSKLDSDFVKENINEDVFRHLLTRADLVKENYKFESGLPENIQVRVILHELQRAVEMLYKLQCPSGGDFSLKEPLIMLPKKEWDEITERLKRIEEMLGKVVGDDNRGSDWVESAEAKKMLGVSQKTWQTYRDNRIIPFSQFGRKIMVRKSDIEEFLQKNMKKSKTEQQGKE